MESNERSFVTRDGQLYKTAWSANEGVGAIYYVYRAVAASYVDDWKLVAISCHLDSNKSVVIWKASEGV